MRHLGAALLAAAISLGGAQVASAQSFTGPWLNRIIERSGNTYHVQACSADVPRGFARCNAHIVTDFRGNFLLHAAPFANRGKGGGGGGGGGGGSGGGGGTTPTPPAPLTPPPPSGYGPANLRAAYNVTATGSTSTVIAVVDAYGYPKAAADLAVYRSQFGLPACTVANGCLAIYNERGSKTSLPATNLGWDQEQALDLDMESAMCPNCKIILVEANTASYGDLAQAENEAVALGARVVANSYGGAESGTQSYESAYNHAGVAITASAGDSGYGVEFPASSPHVIAVGGTSLNSSSTARGWTESVWSGSGSGCSKLYAKPSWQKDPLCTLRMNNDVAAVADPNTGVAAYGPASSRASGWLVFGGTSASAQIVGGIYGVNGAPVSYAASLYSDPAGLNDVTSGHNGSCGGTYFCTAGTGYDGPTGLGTPNTPAAF